MYNPTDSTRHWTYVRCSAKITKRFECKRRFRPLRREAAWNVGSSKYAIATCFDQKRKEFVPQLVSRWLQVEDQMVKSVRHEIQMSYLDYEVTKRVVWVRTWPGMVVLCVSQIYWSMEVQNSLMTHIPSTMEALHTKLGSQILEMVQLVRGTRQGPVKHK